MNSKNAVRRVLHPLGYDIVRLRTELAEYQAALLRRLKIDLLVDVGANQGQYAQRMRALGYAGDIVSLEPGNNAYARLEKAARTDSHWRTIHLAAGEAEGTLTLHVSRNSVSSSLLPMEQRHAVAAPTSQYVADEQVTVRRLDDVLAATKGSSLWLKVDVQGGELSVLRGAAATLKRVSVLQLEVSLVPLYSGQSTYLEVLSAIDALNLVPVAIEPGFQDPATGDTLQIDVIAVQGARR